MTTINGYRYRGIQRFADRHGKVRYYLRATGTALPDPAKGFRNFDRAYWDAINGYEVKHKPVKERPETSRQGTIEQAVTDYLGSSTFEALAKETRRGRRARLNAWVKSDGGKVGRALVATLRPEDIQRGLEARKATPKTANLWLVTVRMLLDHCVTSKRYGIKKNAATGVKRLPVDNSSSGFPDWKEADIPAFEARFPKGTIQYLAKELLLALGQRRSDIIRFNWDMVTPDGMIEFTQQKTGARLRLPLPDTLIEVLPPRSNVVGIDGSKTPFLLNRLGKPFSPDAFSNMIHQAWVEVGRPELSTHGARKLAARRLRKAGCPLALIMAFTGHSTEKQLRVYLGDVEREEMADGLRAWM